MKTIKGRFSLLKTFWQSRIRCCAWIFALPILVWLAWRSFLVLSLLIGYAFTQTEIYLLPQDYIGPVLVIYNQPEGQPVESEGFARVYRIPANGVYMTTAARQQFISGQFFYVDSQGNRTQIYEPYKCSQELTSDMLVVCSMPYLMGHNGQIVPEHRGVVVGRQSEIQELTVDYWELQKVLYSKQSMP